MNAKIEMTMREEEMEERQQATASDSSSYPAPSSSATRQGQDSGPSQGPMQGFGNRPSSQSLGDAQTSAHEGAVSSTAVSSDLTEPSQVGGGEGGRLDPSHALHPPHSSESGSLGGRGGMVSTSTADTSCPLTSTAANRALSPSVGSSQPAPLAKKRIMHRPPFRGDEPQAPAPSSVDKFSSYPASSSRDHPREHSREHPRSSGSMPSKTGSPTDAPRTTPQTKPAPPPPPAPGPKEKKSDLYDFHDDSPDEDGSGRTPSSYMALGTPGRSPRKGHVDSSDSAKPAGEVGAVGSSGDERRGGGGGGGGGGESGKDSNEAQGYESFPTPSSSHQHMDPRQYARRNNPGEVTSGSVDSTHADKPASSSGDDPPAIDSSSERKAKRLSPRRPPNDPESFEAGEATQSRGAEGMGYSQHARSPRARTASTEGGSGFGGVDSSSSEAGPAGTGASSSVGMVNYPPYPAPGSGQPVVSSIMRDADLNQAVCSRDQEPAPLLSAQYETLSDDEEDN